MKIVLFNQGDQLIEAWEREFADYPDVTIFDGPLEDVPLTDCIVAAGNSFGIMDGGLDAAMAYQFPDVVEAVHEAVADNYGEIPVGQSVIVPTGDETVPLLAYTPTMRFPRPIAPELVYDSFRAAVIAAKNHNFEAMIDGGVEIESLAIPGLGANTGQVKPFTVARMMRLGYDSIFERPQAHYKTWDEAEVWLKKLYEKR